jgi:diaminopimelate epimerase
MNIRFAKMHGLGNDFMVIDAITQTVQLTKAQIRQWSLRTRGIGFDQCLVIEPSTEAEVDFNYRIFNADGQEVGQCGNGARCLARFAKYYGLTKKEEFTLKTKTSTMQVRLNADDSVRVDMGQPRLKPNEIPFLAEAAAAEYALEWQKDHWVQIHALSVGNPHAVLLVDAVDQADVAQIGRAISLHPRFPEQTNTSFMQILDCKNIKLRVYERGCGETEACGSAAVAAAAAAHLYHELESTIHVALPGGQLTVEWPNTNASIYLTGPASFVYEGQILAENE